MLKQHAFSITSSFAVVSSYVGFFFSPNIFKQSHVSRNRASSRHTTLKVTLSLSSPRRSQSFPAGDGHLPGLGRSLLSLWLLLSFLVSVF